MKNLKILLLIMTFSSLSQASFMYDQIDRCIEDWYSENGTFYYYRSDTPNTLRSLTTNKTHSRILSGYEYDSVTDRCQPTWARKNGLSEESFNFLLGVIGIIFGGVFMFFTTKLFVIVGGRR